MNRRCAVHGIEFACFCPRCEIPQPEPKFIGDERGRRMLWADWNLLMSVAYAGIGGELQLYAPDGDAVEVAWHRVIDATAIAWPAVVMRPRRRSDKRPRGRWHTVIGARSTKRK